jgi:hypothetical protein
MRSNYMKLTLNAATLAVAALLSMPGVSSAQTINLTASQQTTTTPDGNVVPMWGWTCGAITQGTTLGTSCTALTYTNAAGAVQAVPQPQSAAVTTGVAAGGGAWQPPLIVVPYTSSAGVSTTNLTINLTNALPVETSIMILGQAGGGLGAVTAAGSGPGATAGPVRESGPRTDGDHAGQTATTWTTVAGATFTPPAQEARVRSMVPEVAGVATVGATPVAGTYIWNGLKPGTYLIRTGTYPSIQGPMGLYGVLVVTTAPAGAAAGVAYPAPVVTGATPGSVTYDADVVAMESELDDRQNKMVAALFSSATAGTACSTTVTTGCVTAGPGGSTALAGAAFLETAKWTTSCGAAPNSSLTFTGAVPTCYPPAVDYTPKYFMFNGVAFSRDNQTPSALPVPAAGATGNVLLRFVNAGSHMHTPSVNNQNMLLVAEDANVLPDVALALGWSGGTAKTLSANPAPAGGVCTATTSPACGLNLRTEVFQAAGKVFDVIVSPARTGTSYNASIYRIYDRALEALSNNSARDGGMQAILDVADTAATLVTAANASATALSGAAYSCAPGVSLVISDPGLGVIARSKSTNVYGVELNPRPTNGTNTLTPFGNGATTDSLTLNPDGTFTYTQAATNTTCGGTFGFQVNGNGPTSTVTISQLTAAAPTANPDSYAAVGATLLRIGAPGVLLNDVDPGHFPMTAVLATGCTAPAGATALAAATATSATGVSLNSDGSFTAQTAGAGTYYFCYQAKNSQNVLSTAAAAVTLTFPAASNLNVTVQDAICAANATTAAQLATCAITDYKWIIEQDLSFPVDPLCQVNSSTRPTGSNGQPCPATAAGVPPTPATQFHTSYMPVIAEGCTGPQSCSRGQTVYDPAPNCATTTPVNAPGCSPTGGQHVAAACDGYGICTIGATQLRAALPSSAHLAATEPDGVTPARYYISILSGDSQNAFAYGGNTKDPTDPANNCTPGVNGTPSTEPTGFTTPTTPWGAACGHTMGGAPIPAPRTSSTGGAPVFAPVVVNLQRNPLKTATVTAFVFEDDWPLNGEPDTGGGVDALATLEKPLGDFQIIIWDDAGGVGDFTGQMSYDMFNMPLTNALNGTIDPLTGNDACPIANTGGVAAGVIIVCPTYESDGVTPSPLTGQVVVKNLMQGKFSLVAHPGVAREAAGEEWLQTNSLDGGHALDSFIKVGEPPYFQEFGPGGFHVFFGFANPKHINARLAAICAGTTNPQIPFTVPCRNTLNGQVTNLHQSRSPNENLFGGNVFAQGDARNYASLAYTNCYAAIGDTDGATIALAKCDPNGNFSFTGLPDGDYGVVIFDQWNDLIVDGSSHQVSLRNGQTLNKVYPTFTWQTHLWSRSYMDVGGLGRPVVSPTDGTLDPVASPGLIQVPTRVRHTNGKFVNTLLSDIGGNSRFDETFPLFAWYTVESDTTRFRSTGVHVVNDAGGVVDGPTPIGNGNAGSYQGILNSKETFSVPTDLRVPGAHYCTNADCTDVTTAPFSAGGTGGSTARIDPGSNDVEGWQGGVGQFDAIDWGKIPYAPPGANGIGENGGIRGHVVNATTRPFDDPRMLFQNLWEPLVPNVRINLYQEGVAADGVTPTLTLVDTTTTTSWDAWAQGFRHNANGTVMTSTAGNGGIPNISCPGQDSASDPYFINTLAGTRFYLNPGTAPAYNSQYSCYDGYHNLNQIQPAPYDGLFKFPSATCQASAGAVIPATASPTGAAINCVTIPNPALTSTAVPTTGAAPAILPPGKYVTEVVLPPGWQLNKEEDLNLLIGDQYIASTNPQFVTLANIFITPDQASIDAANLSYTGPNTTGYTPPWTCTTPTSCTLNPSTTNNGKQSQDYGRTSFGNFGPGGLIVQSAPCVGQKRIVPDYLSISPESGEVAPFAGSMRNLCDRKEITLENQMQADVDFYLYTNTPKTTSFTGFISDDMSSEFDPASPAFGEKFAVPNVPVAIRDFNGNEVSRIYSDQWGTFNGLVYSTWEVDPPNITGYSPNMMVTCMNDPGPIVAPVCATGVAVGTNGCVAAQTTPPIMITDPSYNPGYSNFCYENPFMPGDTVYLDTPVVPVSAFAEGYNPPDCAYPDGTPMILSVQGDQIPGAPTGAKGPWVSAANHTILITALTGSASTSPGIAVPNNAYSGPAASTAPYNQKFVTRHYGFGAGATVTIGGLAAGCTAGTNAAGQDTLTCAVPSGMPSCSVLQTNPSTGVKIPAQCGELVITAANGKQSIDTAIVTVSAATTNSVTHLNNPQYVAGENPQSNAIQAAIDKADPGNLIIVGCAVGQASCSYNEMLLMWKPVRLQGIGDGAVTVNANTHPSDKLLPAWRRQVDCLFGLALNGGLITGSNPYDPNGVYTCTTAMANQVDPIPGEPVVGWDATLNGNLAELLQEPTLMGAYEGAAITVLGKGLENNNTANCNPEGAAGCIPLNNITTTGGDCNRSSQFYGSNFLCNPSRIDGLTFTNSSQGGGGVFLHGFNHFTEVSNLHVTGNGGTLTGGITIGRIETLDPTYTLVNGINVVPPFMYNHDTNVHNNAVTFNAAYGDELNSNTPSSAGGVTFCTGADNYKFQHNWVCGNWSSGDGGGLAHHGLSFNGKVTNNWFLFNQSINPSLVTYGGGMIALGTAPDGALGEAGTAGDIDVAPSLSDGIGQGLLIDSNVFQGNTAEEGSGGGLALLHVNGGDVANNPSNPNGWYRVTVNNNIFANNVAGWAGGGVVLADAVLVDFTNNTVASNDSTSSAGVEFNSNGAPNGNIPPPGCDPTANPSCTGSSLSTSVPLPAGFVTERHSSNFLTAFTNPNVTCPANHGSNATSPHQCTQLSIPYLNSDIFWQNRAFSIATNASNGTNAVVLSPNLNQTGGTGSCPAEPAFTSGNGGGGYWDIGVYGDTSPTAGTVRLSPSNSVLSSGGYGGTNSGTAPAFGHQYCNGSRVPPEIATLLCVTPTNGNSNAPGCIRPGAVGVTTWGGVPDSAVPPLPTFSISTAATVDEGNNWINLFYGPLSWTNPTIQSGGAGYNAPLGNYTTASGAGAHLPGPSATPYPFP